LLTCSIDRDLFYLPKCVCTIFAVAALTLSALDLANIRSAEDAAALIHQDRLRAVDLSDWMRAAIESLLAPSVSPFVVVAIPDDEIAAMPELPVIVVEVEPLPPIAVTPEPVVAAEPSPAQRLRLAGDEYTKAERCLADAIYFEARAEPERGQMAVAQVVVNRAFSGFYPKDICGVVYQNADRRSCQFSFACDGKPKTIDEHDAWARADRIAQQILDGQIYLPEVAKSTHFHAVYVHPNWVREMKKVTNYGIHNFYRPIAWGDGLEEPGVSAGKKSN